MEIKIALKKAGMCGKVRRPNFMAGAYVYISTEFRTLEYHASDGSIHTWHPNYTDLTATDWEVVEDKPTIKVNDVVNCNECSQHDKCRVKEIQGDRAIMHRTKRGHHADDLCACDSDMDTLTLIRKETEDSQ